MTNEPWDDIPLTPNKSAFQFTRVGDLKQYWQRSYQLQGTEPGTLTALKGVEQWQVFCFRNASLSNCQSSGDVTQNAGRQQLPQALRVQLSLGAGSGFSGNLSRDMAVSPQMVD